MAELVIIRGNSGSGRRILWDRHLWTDDRAVEKIFDPQVFAYYYDLSFEETVRRHQTRAKQEEFTPADMKRWWKDRDFLGWEEEAFFTDEDSLEAAFDKICSALGKTEYNSK